MRHILFLARKRVIIAIFTEGTENLTKRYEKVLKHTGRLQNSVQYIHFFLFTLSKKIHMHSESELFNVDINNRQGRKDRSWPFVDEKWSFRTQRLFNVYLHI